MHWNFHCQWLMHIYIQALHAVWRFSSDWFRPTCFVIYTNYCMLCIAHMYALTRCISPNPAMWCMPIAMSSIYLISFSTDLWFVYYRVGACVEFIISRDGRDMYMLTKRQIRHNNATWCHCNALYNITYHQKFLKATERKILQNHPRIFCN